MNSTNPKDNPGVLAFPPLIWALSAVVSGLLHLIRPQPITSYHLLLGLAFTGLALALVSWAFRTMQKAGTNINPSQPALTIVRAGPYRFTRNPMYLALCLLQVGLAFLLNDWGALLCLIPLAIVLHYGVILREEKYLATKFGEPYLALRREVRRWI